LTPGIEATVYVWALRPAGVFASASFEGVVFPKHFGGVRVYVIIGSHIVMEFGGSTISDARVKES
jgi:hypothetical protein